MIIETHFHLSHNKFDNSHRQLTYNSAFGLYEITEGNRDTLVEAMKQQGIVAAIEPRIELESNNRLLDLARKYRGWLFLAVGLHPTRTANEKWRDRSTLIRLSK